MAQTLGTAIEPTALVATPAPLAASFPSKGASDSTAQQSRTHVSAAVTAARNVATEEASPPAATQAVIDSINAELLTAGKTLELSVDSESERSVVILRDTATGDVIGQFPTEQVLRMQALLGSSNPHLLVDITA